MVGYREREKECHVVVCTHITQCKNSTWMSLTAVVRSSLRTCLAEPQKDFFDVFSLEPRPALSLFFLCCGWVPIPYHHRCAIPPYHTFFATFYYTNLHLTMTGTNGNGNGATIGTSRVKQGLAQMLKGGVIVSQVEDGTRTKSRYQ